MTAPQRLTRTPAIVVPSWCVRHSSSRMASTSLLALGDCAAPAPWHRMALYTHTQTHTHTHTHTPTPTHTHFPLPLPHPTPLSRSAAGRMASSRPRRPKHTQS